MDDAAGALVAFVLGIVAFALVVSGLVWIVVHLWPVLVLVAIAALAWRLNRHPGVQARRQIRDAVRQGQEAQAQIRTATEQAKAEMDRIARDQEV